MRESLVAAALAFLLGACDAAATAPSDAPGDAAEALDSSPADAAPFDAPDAAEALDASRPDAPRIDSGTPDDLAAHRERLIATLGASCTTWAGLEASQRAVFLTITHRLFVSFGPDGRSMLSHVERVHAVLGGGSSGTTCGGSDNNRLFLSTDAYLHGLLLDTWNDLTPLSDGAGSTWLHTHDLAGPHDPFDASVETDVGLRCALLFETSSSRPPTAQAHFFVGAPVAFSRGTASLPADPFLLEVDQDYNCVHDSNPTCSDFEERYRTNHGDFECAWVPAACTATGTGCYRDVI